jgi:hypothetical protein
MYKKEMTEYLVGLQKYSTSDLTKLVEQLDIHKPSNKCLIALTEAGTQDLISWGSRQYEDNGLAKKMINTGFHSYEIWLSVLFQMYQSFMCMFKHGISFQNFDINSNVSIKSLKQDANITITQHLKILLLTLLTYALYFYVKKIQMIRNIIIFISIGAEAQRSNI